MPFGLPEARNMDPRERANARSMSRFRRKSQVVDVPFSCWAREKLIRMEQRPLIFIPST
jgi:hypothetical protein